MTAPATGPCECCGRQNAILVPARAPDGLPGANRICAIFLRHLGDVASIARRREAQHAEMWAEDQRKALEERHGCVFASLQQQVAQRADRCAVAGIVTSYPALRFLEDKQTEFLRRGLKHLLLEGHPAVLDRRTGVPDVLLDDVEDSSSSATRSR